MIWVSTLVTNTTCGKIQQNKINMYTALFQSFQSFPQISFANIKIHTNFWLHCIDHYCERVTKKDLPQNYT